jgi:hypothetical protein
MAKKTVSYQSAKRMFTRLLRTRPVRRLRRFMTLDGFAMAPVWVQLSAIFIGSASIIALLSPLIGSLGLSYRLFTDPSSYADIEGVTHLLPGLLQVLFGLILFSFIISVLSAALEQFIERIKGGSLPCRKSGHILIINYNAKLPLILDEIDQRASREQRVEDIVLLFGQRNAVDIFSAQLDPKRWQHLEIYIRQGDLMAFETYRDLGILGVFGLVILASDDETSAFARDNTNLKILTALINERAFLERLIARHRARQPVKCSIELSSCTHPREIAMALTRDQGQPLFAIISPGEIIGSVLARSIIDIAYYKIYFEILSFYGHNVQFVDQRGFAAAGVMAGASFRQLVLGFSGGTLIGYSRTNADGQFQLWLCPFEEPLQPTDWLLFITSNAQAITYTPEPADEIESSAAINPPSEILSRRLCVIGSTWPIDNLENFLDQESREALRASHFVYENVEDYFAPSFLARLRSIEWDNIIINLDDDTGFRLTLYLITACAGNDPFLEKIVTVLSDPIIEELLNKNTKYRNTVLSHKLAAKYIAQITFQKNLEKLFTELSFAEGAEFNLLDVGTHIPRAMLADEAELKRTLIAHELVYVGIVDENKSVQIGAKTTAHAHQIIVLGHGDA